MKLEVKQLPKVLALTQEEQNLLESLCIQQQSSMEFWKRALCARGISCPHSRVLMMVPQAQGEFRLEWHPKALGPQAIAKGLAYRAFSAAKDKEFQAKLQRRGAEVWT